MARRIETGSEYLGAEQVITPGEVGSESIEVLEKPIPTSAIELEKFMHEPVTIIVSEGSDDTDADLVYVGVNGVGQYIRRGIPQTIKRKYVERLARAKPTDYTQDLDSRMGEAMNRMRKRSGFKYPFTVVADANPKGSAWLQAILSERQ